MKHISELLQDWIDDNPEVKARIEATAGPVCPDCEEGPDKCHCDNAYKPGE
jgi:hypothetical protein